MSASLNPVSPFGAAAGATIAHSSGRKPATSLTPPIVVRGSRSPATSATVDDASAESSRSNSRYACELVPSAKMPDWGDADASLSTDAGRPLRGRAPRSTLNRSPGMKPDYRLGRAPVAPGGGAATSQTVQ